MKTKFLFTWIYLHMKSTDVARYSCRFKKVYAWVCVYVRVCVCVFCVHTHTHTHTNTHTATHIHTQYVACSCSSSTLCVFASHEPKTKKIFFAKQTNKRFSSTTTMVVSLLLSFFSFDRGYEKKTSLSLFFYTTRCHSRFFAKPYAF